MAEAVRLLIAWEAMCLCWWADAGRATSPVEIVLVRRYELDPVRLLDDGEVSVV